MRCPYCREINQDKVIDSRLSENGQVIRRRRLCTVCGKRFTTKERIENEVKLTVIKRDGRRMPYDRARIIASIQRAAYKRPIDQETFVQIADKVEDQLFKRYDREVHSLAIGALVGERLKKIDQIAYVRFASVYRRFKDLGELIEEAREIADHIVAETPGQQKLFE
jgi:transcriptional repressor NrdR